MALINQNQLFDRLQEYIDKKVTSAESSLEALFEEYGLKTIVDNLPAINAVADDIDNINLLAPASDAMQTIVDTPGLIDDIQNAEENATQAELDAWVAEAEAMTSDSYASQPVGEQVIEYTSNGDGTFTEITQSMYSSLHYAVVSLAAAEGLTFQGLWDLTLHTDPATEPPAPVPLDDPANPGTPLPFANGMYWFIKGDSIYTGTATPTDPIIPYPTFGPEGTPYVDNDQIMYVSAPQLPYDPWFKKRDIVNWDRLIEIPSNVMNALSTLGTTDTLGSKMIGDLLIEKVDPKVILRNTSATDSVMLLMNDAAGNLAVYKTDDAGGSAEVKMIVYTDSLKLALNATNLTYDDAKVWTENNDGAGSGLDADMIQGLFPDDLIRSYTVNAPALDTLIDTGVYMLTGISPAIYGATSGTLIVTKESNAVKQLFSSGLVIATRESGDNGSTWPSTWNQFGSMVFSGGVLDITLPV